MFERITDYLAGYPLSTMFGGMCLGAAIAASVHYCRDGVVDPSSLTVMLILMFLAGAARMLGA